MMSQRKNKDKTHSGNNSESTTGSATGKIIVEETTLKPMSIEEFVAVAENYQNKSPKTSKTTKAVNKDEGKLSFR